MRRDAHKGHNVVQSMALFVCLCIAHSQTAFDGLCVVVTQRGEKEFILVRTMCLADRLVAWPVVKQQQQSNSSHVWSSRATCVAPHNAH